MGGVIGFLLPKRRGGGGGGTLIRERGRDAKEKKETRKNVLVSLPQTHFPFFTLSPVLSFNCSRS